MLTDATNRILRISIFSLSLILIAGRAHAHVNWTRLNDVDTSCVALYHIDETIGAPGTTINVAAGLPTDRSLIIATPSGASMQHSSDTVKSLFSPFSLFIQSPQSAISDATIGGLDGDLTVEFYFKWNAALTSQSLQVGLLEGAKLTLARDTAHPANDRFGVTFAHGDYASAPGFTNWVDVGPEEAGLGTWWHLATTIHSTGLHEDVGLAHDVYNDDSTARFWLNGHAVGIGVHTVPLAGLRSHDDSQITIQNLAGQIRIDEITIWNTDWSQDGSVVNPFANGRGNGLPLKSAAKYWESYR